MEINIGRSINIAMAMAGVTASQMQADLDISRQCLYKWRNSKHINTEKLEMLAEYFEMSVCDFIGL
mgnify:CR=1 FL=1